MIRGIMTKPSHVDHSSSPNQSVRVWFKHGSNLSENLCHYRVTSQRQSTMYTLIVTAKMNGADPQAWLANVLARINAIPQSRLHELLPWNRVPQIENTSVVKAA